MERQRKIQRKRKVDSKNKLKPHNIILVLGLVYFLISVLVVISYVSKMNSISSTMVTFGTVIASVWWQILMIVLFAICYILYKSKHKFGVLLEIMMAMSMLIYIVMSVATMGINLFALIIELIYPLILVFHGLSELKKLNNKNKDKNMISTI